MVHRPARHVGTEPGPLAGHETKHTPQFCGSVWKSSTQAAPQVCRDSHWARTSAGTASGAAKASRGLPASTAGGGASGATSGTGGASARDGGASAATTSAAASTTAPASAQTHTPSVPSAPHV